MVSPKVNKAHCELVLREDSSLSNKGGVSVSELQAVGLSVHPNFQHYRKQQGAGMAEITDGTTSSYTHA